MMRIHFVSSTCSVPPQEDTLVLESLEPLESPEAGAPEVDKDFMIDASNTMQTLLCLNELTNSEANDSDQVRVYAKLADEKLQALRELMRPILWHPEPTTADLRAV